MGIQEIQPYVCGRCGTSYATQKSSSCTVCNVPIFPHVTYQRKHLERLVVWLTMPFIFVIALFFSGDKNILDNAFILLIGSGVFYSIAKWIGLINFNPVIFKNKYDIPKSAQKKFSWEFFFKEVLYFAVIVLILSLIILSARYCRELV